MANTQKILVKQTGAEKTAGSIKKVDRSIAGLTTSALAYTAAAGAILAIAKKTIDAYGIQEQAEKKLETALGGVNTALLAQASALQQVTVFGDEAIIGVQASIAAFTQSEEDIKKATEATLDFASAMGFDLKSAGELIAKTLGSSTNALTRYGVEVTGAVGSTERLTTLTEGISKLWGGQATAAADTMTGSMEQASNAVGDAAEAFGKLLAPAVTISAKGIKILAEGLSDTLSGLHGIELIAQKFDLLTISETNSAEELKRFSAGLHKFTKEELIELAEKLNEGNGALSLWNETSELTASKVMAISDAMGFLSSNFTDINLQTKELSENLVLLLAPMFEEQSLAAQDLSTNIQGLYLDNEGYIDSFSESMIAAAIHGESMKDVLINASKALAIQLIADFAKRKIASMLGLAELTVANTAAAKLTALAWATPASLHATATAGGSAVAGGIALTAAVVEANAIAAFATGADFVTNGPQLIMVGDNHSGEEHVQVTPMGGDPNINGPSGGLVVNFYGPVTSRQFVRDDIIPEIKKAVRLNA